MKKVLDVASTSSEDSVKPRLKRKRARESKQARKSRRVPTLEESSESGDIAAQTRAKTVIKTKRKRIAKESARAKNGPRTRNGGKSAG